MLRKFPGVFILATFALIAVLPSVAASKPHVVSFGKPMQVKLFLGPDEDRTMPLQVRPLYVDSKLKEFTTGELHDVTERIFVVRRAFRLNNNLPLEDRKVPNWVWQKGNWLMVDRLTGRVSQLNLPEFDPFYSEATWFRDYVAYCGVRNGDKLFAIVAQLGIRKPIAIKDLGPASGGDVPDSECAPPDWEKKPTRVTFLPKRGEKISFQVFGHAADIAPGSTEESE